ncbi:MAG: anti-anti-sigma factor [Phycisphaerae bacterium]|nr:anti-anti-sigma factor [Phycisphaerae bacterium]|tara:strand:+ start:131 stop:490 length:360 start_codon:yes stop_codon:yes gene_type:complete
MTHTDSRLRVKQQDGITKVEFIDRNILDEANIQSIGDELGAMIESASDPKLLISFANVDHLSSAALGALITVNNRVKGKRGQLKLADIDPQIYEVFVITRLNQLFDIHDTSDQAAQSFA